MTHFRLKFLPFILLGAMMASSGLALAAPSASTTSAYTAFEKETNKAKQSEKFISFVEDNATYVGTQSYCGKSGKWLAFVDFYGIYEKGVLQSFVLRQATIQNNARSLPAETESATISINGQKETIQYKKQSLFSFSNMEIAAPEEEKELLAFTPLNLEKKEPFDIKASVKVDGKTINIPISKDYFCEETNKDQVGSKEVLSQMASAYADYIKKNKVAIPNHVVLRLKSFITDTTAMTRSYSWELYLLEEEKLPSPSILIRYDCETQKVSIAKREFKTYF